MKDEFLTANNDDLFLTVKNFACARTGARWGARCLVGEGMGKAAGRRQKAEGSEQ